MSESTGKKVKAHYRKWNLLLWYIALVATMALIFQVTGVGR